MAFENLSDREKAVLLNLIKHYVETADPVGSRVIASRYDMGLSSATIRNTLQDLEDLGLVQQPHISAGRIPTDLGYRVYVDYYLKPEILSEAEKEHIKQSILKEGRGVNDILGQTCRVLSDITKQLGISIAPRFEEGVLHRLELIPITDERIMAVVVVKSGLARSVIIEVRTTIGERELKEVESALNERLAGLTLGEIRKTIAERLSGVGEDGKLIKLLIDSKNKIWTDERSGDLRSAGVENLLLQPEFMELDHISNLVRIIEDGKVISDFLDSAEQEGLVITIGKENRFSEIMNCSLVISSYRVGKISGTVGVIGPTRMAYNKLASVVECTARTITDVLAGIEEDEE